MLVPTAESRGKPRHILAENTQRTKQEAKPEKAAITRPEYIFANQVPEQIFCTPPRAPIYRISGVALVPTTVLQKVVHVKGQQERSIRQKVNPSGQSSCYSPSTLRIICQGNRTSYPWYFPPHPCHQVQELSLVLPKTTHLAMGVKSQWEPHRKGQPIS